MKTKYTGMNKREIKPHKGGRTARLPEGRCTPDDLERLKQILSKRNISFADWVTEKIKEDL